eukprot:COSAG01_NODE_9488_length_2433_cov_1802.802057_1_plen_138_part_00
MPLSSDLFRYDDNCSACSIRAVVASSRRLLPLLLQQRVQVSQKRSVAVQASSRGEGGTCRAAVANTATARHHVEASRRELEPSKWRAQIRVDDQVRHPGCFAEEAEAARAFDAAHRQHSRQEAHCNFPKRKQKKRKQ